MEEIAEITEIVEELIENDFDQDIERGLEIVALEMGHVLEELQDNIERISCTNPPRTILKMPKCQVLQNVKPYESISCAYEKPSNEKPKISPPTKILQPKSVSQTLKIETPKSVYQNLKIHKPNYKVQKVYHNGSFEKDISKNISNKTSSFIEHQHFRRDINDSYKSIEKYNGKANIIQQPSKSSHSSKRKKTLNNIKSKYRQGNDVLKELREHVETAIHEKKTFTISGNFYAIRRALLSRGWVEKMRISYNTYDRDNLLKLQSSTIQDLVQGLHDPQKGYIYKRMIMTKMLGQNQVDFYWDLHSDCFRLLNDKIKHTMVNRFKRDAFSYTTKQGLCESMKNAYWYQNDGISRVRHPRSYNLSNNEDPKEFINDFKLTAAMSVLKWVVRNKTIGKKHEIISDKGQVPISAYHFAATEVAKALRRCNHEDIDFEIEEAMDYEWNAFLEHYYKIVHIGTHFKCQEGLVGVNTITSLQKSAKSLLTKIEKFWPHLKMDGIMNVWILKPTNGCRGQGIYLCRTLQYILKIIKSNTSRKYIIQKYIERPLLICNTKFDIRQWFLISCAAPLTIWIYKDCYLRFSSQLYTLHKLHESIHLTNNSIQSRYKNSRRNPLLPDCNMWDSNQFKKYLSSIGHPSAFQNIIYPGMKECLTATILMNQNNLDTRRNCFELYGSDFMLTEDFKPWLIEVNARPALFASTPVTARLCPQVLEDLIKVVIDTVKNPNAPTGKFELLYRENREKLPAVNTSALNFKVQELPTSYFYNPEVQIVDFAMNSVSSQTDIDLAHLNIKKISAEMKKTLENLLDLIQTEREKRKILKNNFSQAYDIQEIFTCKTEPDEPFTNEKRRPSKHNVEIRCGDELNVIQKTNENWELINNSPSISQQDYYIEQIVTECQNQNGDLQILSKDSLEEVCPDNKNDLKYQLANENLKNTIEDTERVENIAGTELLVSQSSNDIEKLGATKSIFLNIINSIRNLRFACKNTTK